MRVVGENVSVRRLLMQVIAFCRSRNFTVISTSERHW